MTEREKEIAEKLATTISKMSEPARNYFLGFGEGLAYKRETEKAKAS